MTKKSIRNAAKTAQVGSRPESPRSRRQEPDGRHHGQADGPEVVPLQGRESDAESRDDEGEAGDLNEVDAS